MTAAESQKKILRSRLAAAAVEAITVISCSLKQISIVYDEVNIIQDKLEDPHDYNFGTTMTINFFPKQLLKHIETFADQKQAGIPKQSKVRRRLVSATRKHRKGKSKKPSASKSKKNATEAITGDNTFLTNIGNDDDDRDNFADNEKSDLYASDYEMESGMVESGDREQANEHTDTSRRTEIEHVSESIVYDNDFEEDEKDSGEGKSSAATEDAAAAMKTQEDIYTKISPGTLQGIQDSDGDVNLEYSEFEDDDEIMGTTDNYVKRSLSRSASQVNMAPPRASSGKAGAAKKKKKKLSWNDSPCAECKKAFRGKG